MCVCVCVCVRTCARACVCVLPFCVIGTFPWRLCVCGRVYKKEMSLAKNSNWELCGVGQASIVGQFDQLCRLFDGGIPAQALCY